MDAITSLATDRVANWLIEEVKFLKGVKEQVEEMKMELEWMQCFLEDADKNPISSRTFHHWVSQIKEANYEAEDAIDSFLARASLRRKRRNWFKRFAHSIVECTELREVGCNIETINARLSTLRSRLQTYGVMGLSAGGREINGSGSSSQMIMPRAKNQSFSFIADHIVVGLDPRIQEVVGHLLAAGENMVSVYGTGGIGKTTLSKKVYHHKKIRRHFRSFAWIYVTQQFAAKDLWGDTLMQLTSATKKDEKQIEKMGEEEVKRRLKSLYGGDELKRCLVVVDGVRNHQEWDILSDGFPTSSGKSKLLLITRNKDLAKGNGFLPFKLLPLDEDNGWELLEKMVGDDAKNIPKVNAMELGKQMLQHCMGYPLAIVLLGGILSKKTSSWEWKEVLDNIRALSRRCGNNEEWFGVLVLSYLDLPNWLKPCFLYLSQFPEDHEIKTKQLLRMWMAEGLIYTSTDEIEEEEIMEDVAERNLNELACRYLIQVKDEGSTGRIKTCGMHNVIREMCLWKAKQEKFVHIVNLTKSKNETMEALSSSVDDNSSSTSSSVSSVSNVTNIRRIAIFAGKGLDADTLPQNNRFRSFVCFSSGKGVDLVEWRQSKQNLKKLECLRVLVIEGVLVKDIGLAREIGTLSCLGYLSLSGSHISNLSSLPFNNLISLETLDLRYCAGYTQDVPIVWKWKMENLRHLYLPKGDIKIDRLHNLPNLETLVNYHIRDFDSFRKLMIRHLSKLRKLTLRADNASRVKDLFPSNEQVVFGRIQSLCIKSPYESEAMLDLEAVMTGCPNLFKLSIQCRVEKAPQQADKLASSHLTKVHLKLCGLSDLSWLGKLQHLTILFLECDSFAGTKMHFRENEFLQLKHLELDDLSNLAEWIVDAGAMPSLCRLEINWCLKLQAVPEGLRDVSNLKEMEIRGMPLEFREKIEKGGQDYPIVKHVHHISFVDCDDGDD